MSAGVMSTEVETGATPASFCAHANDRGGSSEIFDSVMESMQKYGTVVECGYDYYTASRISVIEGRIEKVLDSVSLPTKTEFSAKDLTNIALADKKRSGSTVNLIIPADIGNCIIFPTPVSDLQSFIEAGL
jgi:hypothetical protein